jgi:hypothetical protein
MSSKPTVWLPGLDRQDRLFLWWLAYRLPGPFEIDPAQRHREAQL